MYFSNLKSKFQKMYRIKNYDDILLQIVSSMIEYEGDNIPEEIKDRLNAIEIFRIQCGAAAIWKLKEEDITGQVNQKPGYVISAVEFAGEPDINSIGIETGMDAICYTSNGIVKEFKNWRENPDIAVIFLNNIQMPDMYLGMVSDMLSEVSVSLKMNTFFSRFYPILIADDKKKQKVINKIVKNMMAGGNVDTNELETIIDENSLRSIMAENGVEIKGIEKIDIGEVDKSSYIQYLCKFRDDLMRWFYSLYGMNSQGSSKMAQQTTDEVNQDSNSSMIIPYTMYSASNKGCDMVNDKFDWEIKPVFSKCWAERILDLTDEAVNVDEVEEISDDLKEEIDKSEELTDDAEDGKIEEDKEEKSNESEEKTDED